MRSIAMAVAVALSLGGLQVRAEEQAAPVAKAPETAADTLVARLHPELFGYVKAGFFLVVPQSQDALVGSNSGFRLMNARLGVALHPAETLHVVLSLDGSVSLRKETDPLEGSRIVALKDAYLQWDGSRFTKLRAGQFKAPFNGEVLLPDDALPFIQRSIVSEGLLPPEGFRVAGLALERQVGLELSSDKLGGDFNVQYAVALVNGNGPNVLNNDNNSLSPAARVQAGYKELVTVGVNAFQNRASIGERPNRITESHLAYGADVTLNVGGLNLFGMFLQKNVTHDDTGLPSEQAMGVVGSARYLYEPLGLEGGARFAYYEPSSAIAADNQSELALMVGYRPAKIPARILLQYTMRIEEAAARIGNDSVDLMAQVTF